jgi:hypothetical protein
MSALLLERKNSMLKSKNAVQPPPPLASPFMYYPFPGPYPSTPAPPSAGTSSTSDKPLFNKEVNKDAEYLKIEVKVFCHSYLLRDELRDRLLEKGFTVMRALRKVTWNQLKDMGFPDGDIIMLADAIEDWLDTTKPVPRRND